MHSGAKSLTERYYVVEIVCCLLIVVPFCTRIWGFGLTTTDDGNWALWMHQSNQHPILDFARIQGRFWAFGGGGWIALGLWFHDNWFGNALIVGSFLLFFVLFIRVLSVYWSAPIAFGAAGIFMAVFAFRADRSILYSYPLFFWIPASAVITAMLLARRFQLEGGFFRLCLSASLLLLGLFNNEGFVVLTLTVFAAALLVNYWQSHDRGSLQSIRWLRWNIVVHAIVGGTFIAASVAWRLRHPSAYSGNMLAPFDAHKIGATLFNFTTSGTVLYDLVHPYVQQFADTLLQRSVRMVYEPKRYWADAFANPVNFIAGALAACLMARALSRQIVADQKTRLPALAVGIVTGLVIATLPLLPVAMTSQYQSWFYLYDAHAYSHTIFATFGLALTASCLCGLLMTARRISPRGRCGAAVLIACVFGVLATVGNQMNDAIARDLRPEGARWHVAAALTRMAAATESAAETVFVPRLRNGTWFAVMPPGYWSEYTRDVLGSALQLSDRMPTVSDLKRGAGYADYELDRDGRQLIITWAHAASSAGTAAPPVANRLTVLVEDSSNPAAADRILAFDDVQRGLRQIPLRDMKPIGQGLWTVDGVQAAPTSARVLDQSAAPNPIIDCGAPVPFGMPLIASIVVPAGRGCLASLYLKRGWAASEPGGNWTNGRTATIELPLDGPPPPKLRLNIDATSYTGMGFYGTLQTVSLRIKGRLAATWEFRPGSAPLPPVDVSESDWSPASPSGQNLLLEFEIDPPYQPKRLGLAPDERELGLLLRSITLERIAD